VKIRQQIYSDIADGHHQSVIDKNLLVPPDVTLPEKGILFGYCVQVLVRMVDLFLFRARSLKKNTLGSFMISNHCPNPPPWSSFVFAFQSSNVHRHPQHLLHPVTIIDSTRQLMATLIALLGGAFVGIMNAGINGVDRAVLLPPALH
jgi:hypothetical protein